MSDSEVIQGRLGWEPGDVSEADPENLQPHPKNEEIYDDTGSADQLDEVFCASVAEKGVLEPLVITRGKKIVSGHRRWLAAKDAGLNTVPVRYTEFDDDLAEREALIEFNRQREKTEGQLVREFEEILAIEQERARERQEDMGRELGGDTDETPSGNVSTRGEDAGNAREKAAEKVNANVSGRTLEKGLKVKEKAEQGDEKAQEAWQELDRGESSFSGAYDKATDDQDSGTDDGDDSSDIEQFTSQQTDEWSSPREIVEPLTEAIGGFDLDPCSGAESSAFADETYTENDDGLRQDWEGSVWVNPPYSEVQLWVNKAAQEVARGHADQVMFLCKGDSSTNWWQSAASHADCVLAIDHRLSFGDGENSAPFASHIFLFGDVTDALAQTLSEHGTVMTFGWSEGGD
jgi:phage N-6-adenine-methyltransferase